VIVGFLTFEIHARAVFVASGYPRRNGHGKSWKRAHKHYKSNWSTFQRLLWVFVFKESYEDRYVIMAYLSYTHFVISLLTIIMFVIDEFVFTQISFWIYFFGPYAALTMIRFIQSDYVAKGKIKWR